LEWVVRLVGRRLSGSGGGSRSNGGETVREGALALAVEGALLASWDGGVGETLCRFGVDNSELCAYCLKNGFF